MNLLVDTHLILWAAGQPEKLSKEASELMATNDNQLIFSAASLLEITIKLRFGRKDFRVEPHLLRRGLLDNGWNELSINSQHAIAMGDLENICLNHI